MLRLPMSEKPCRKLPGVPESSPPARPRAFAHFRLFRDEAQAVEVHVRAARDGHQVLVAQAMALDPGLGAGDGASAPAGSRMERVSSNTSLMAAQMASLSTRIMSSTYLAGTGGRSRRPPASPRRRRRTARPAASMRSPARATGHRVGVDGSTPMIRTSGRRRLM
jgi:hypothetical protein